MKIINVEQGSPEWLSWRKTVITATDCPAILGSSPWTTPYKCWGRKLGIVEEQKSNQAMEEGRRLEPEARDQFIERHGINMTPCVVDSTEFEFLGASLDGLSDCGKYILEIKCSSKLYNMASQGIIPEYYMHQMQHQLLVTGARKCFYYAYYAKECMCIEILPDVNFFDEFMSKARAFWKCVAFNEPPALQKGDYRDMSTESNWISYSDIYKDICEKIKNLEETKETYRKYLLKLCEDQSCMGNGIQAIKKTVKGRIVYDDIPEIKEINLDKYRKASTTVWTILVE